MRLKLILLSTLCAFTTFAQAQPEPLDILSFTAPEGYEREQVTGGVQFSRTSDNGSHYCTITLYVSETATDDTQAEFKNEWNALVRKSRNVEAPAEPQAAPPQDG